MYEYVGNLTSEFIQAEIQRKAYFSLLQPECIVILTSVSQCLQKLSLIKNACFIVLCPETILLGHVWVKTQDSGLTEAWGEFHIERVLGCFSPFCWVHGLRTAAACLGDSCPPSFLLLSLSLQRASGWTGSKPHAQSLKELSMLLPL